MKVSSSHALAALAAALLLTTGAAQARTEACHAITEKGVAQLFDRWNESLKTLDPAKVTANYAADGVLLPTLTNAPRTTPADINAYFVKFLKNKPEGTIDQRVIKIGCNTAQDVGTYTFSFKDGSKVSARYTYVYGFQDGKWLISHHHSSAMPEKD